MHKRSSQSFSTSQKRNTRTKKQPLRPQQKYAKLRSRSNLREEISIHISGMIERQDRGRYWLFIDSVTGLEHLQRSNVQSFTRLDLWIQRWVVERDELDLAMEGACKETGYIAYNFCPILSAIWSRWDYSGRPRVPRDGRRTEPCNTLSWPLMTAVYWSSTDGWAIRKSGISCCNPCWRPTITPWQQKSKQKELTR